MVGIGNNNQHEPSFARYFSFFHLSLLILDTSILSCLHYRGYKLAGEVSTNTGLPISSKNLITNRKDPTTNLSAQLGAKTTSQLHHAPSFLFCSGLLKLGYSCMSVPRIRLSSFTRAGQQQACQEFIKLLPTPFGLPRFVKCELPIQTHPALITPPTARSISL